MSKIGKIITTVVVGAPIVALLAFIASFWGKSILAGIAGLTAVSWLWFVLILVGAVAGLLAVSDISFGGKFVAGSTAFVIVVTLVVTAGLYGPISATRYQDVFTETKDPIPAVEERSSFIQANALLTTNVGGLQGRPTEATHLGDSTWSVVMSGNGLGLGTTAVVEWDGEGETSSNFRNCPTENVPAIGGVLGNSLPRAMRQVIPVGPYAFEMGDLYGFCADDGSGTIIAPLTKRSWGFPSMVTYGGLVEVRSGGQITYHGEVEPGQFPGPVYPVSLVERIEQANSGRRNSLRDTIYSNDLVLREDTEPVVENTDPNADPNAAEGGSPNADNYGQFVLSGEDGELWAVTPMQRAKSSIQVVAVAYTRVDQGKAGEINPVTLYELPQFRKSGTEVQRTLRGAFAELNWVGGRRVFEITPVDNDMWVGSIGTSVYASQRFTIDADGRICVFDLPSGKSRGCSADDGSTTDVPAETSPGQDVPAGNAELESLELDALIAQRDEIQQEIDRRARNGS